MRFNFIFRKTFGTLLLVTALAISCKKDTSAFIPNQNNTNPVLKIREIVGNKGLISILGKPGFPFSGKIIEQINDSSLRLLTLQEFNVLYNELNNTQFIQIGLDSNLNRKKSFTEYADDDYDDPGKPGLHKVQFYAFPKSIFDGTYGVNNSPFSFCVLNLWYETDIHGQVIGNPQLFYTGITFLQVWTQLTSTSITFDKNKSTSTFSIGGTNLYGINLLGQNIGWTTSSKFIITINMGSEFGPDGKVNIKPEQN